MDLSVGRLIAPFEEAAAIAFERRGLLYAPEWRKCADNIAQIDIFNLASVNAFIEYISKVEKRSQATNLRHLPTHVYDVWLPFDFEPTTEPEISDGYWPVPLLSSPRLLAELDQIRGLSDLDIGRVPSGYELMRNNPKEFYKSEVQLDENTMIQWVWQGLHDAAELSVQHSAPVLASE